MTTSPLPTSARAKRVRGPAHPPREVAGRLSIGLVRDLRPGLMPNAAAPERPVTFLQAACDDSLVRIADDPRCAAMEMRTLFSRTRSLFAAHEQLRALTTIERHLARAARVLSRGRR